MAKNMIELKGKAASAFFKAAVQSIKPDSERLEAAGFKQTNPSRFELEPTDKSNGLGLVVIINDIFAVHLCILDGEYLLYRALPHVKTVDDVLTLARLLGLSQEVE